ncbi:unnamed protein product, partial [Vicia faba]
LKPKRKPFIKHSKFHSNSHLFQNLSSIHSTNSKLYSLSSLFPLNCHSSSTTFKAYPKVASLQMAPKFARGKGVGRSKGRVGSSSSSYKSIFDLVDKYNMDFFDEKFRGRIMAKQHYYKRMTAEDLHIPEVISRIDEQGQGLTYILQLTQQYNEDLVQIFYAGLEKKNFAEFSFRISGMQYTFTNDNWKSLFGFTIGKEPKVKD